ncbi:MAG: hypothetical protein II532_01605 [Bacteroidales bacterium]|nr:hypothetical protein [Bacteroidales bacterium]
MNKISSILLTAALLFSLAAQAQFKQDFHKVEYMLKVEGGYMPFMTNAGHAGNFGYYNDDLRHVSTFSIINGVCVSQDFFVGLGLAYNYMARPDNFADGWHGGMAYVDFDYRPLEEEWAPMFYARAGGSYLMGEQGYGNTLTGYAELGLGLNWYFNYVYSNMERNYKSIYLTIGFAYMQQATYLPIRLGVRF